MKPMIKILIGLAGLGVLFLVGISYRVFERAVRWASEPEENT